MPGDFRWMMAIFSGGGRDGHTDGWMDGRTYVRTDGWDVQIPAVFYRTSSPPVSSGAAAQKASVKRLRIEEGISSGQGQCEFRELSRSYSLIFPLPLFFLRDRQRLEYKKKLFSELREFFTTRISNFLTSQCGKCSECSCRSAAAAKKKHMPLCVCVSVCVCV